MIIGTGLDIVHVPRIKSAVERFGDRFLSRTFCLDEIDWCLGKRVPYTCLAGRFAVKEAFVKALGTGFRLGITLKQVCVHRLPSGAPELKLTEKALETAKGLGVIRIHVSISHEVENAVAMVILEGG